MAGQTVEIGRGIVTVMPRVDQGSAAGIQNSLQNMFDGTQIGNIFGQQFLGGMQSQLNPAMGQMIGQQTTQPASQSGQQAGTSFGQSFMSGVAALGIGAAVVGGIMEAMEQGNQGSVLASRLGLTMDEAKKYNDDVTSVFTAGYGESRDSVSNAFGSILGTIKDARKMSGEELQGMAKDVINMETTFGFASSEINTSVQSMMSAGVVKSFDEGMNVLTAGLQTGGDKANDLLDTFREYSGDFASLGLSGADSLGMINGLLDAGVMNTDKAADGMRELFTRTRNGDQATIDSLAAIGLNAENIQAQFIKGGSAAQEGYGAVISALNKAEGKIKSDAVTNLFGSPGEDFYQAFNKGINPQVGASIDGIQNATDKVDENFTNAASTVTSFKRSALQVLTEYMGNYVIPAIMEFGKYFQSNILPTLKVVGEVIKNVVDFMVEWKDVIIPLVVVFGTFLGILKAITIAQTIWTSVTTGFIAVQTALNVVMAMNPIGLIVIAIISLVAGFIYLWNNVEGFRNFWIDSWTNIQNIVGGFINWITETALPNIGNFFGTIGAWFGNIPNVIGSAFNTVVSFFGNVFTTIGEFFHFILVQFGGFLVSVFEGVVGLGPIIGNFFGSIWSSIGDGFNTAVQFVGDGINKLLGFFSSMGEKIGRVFENIGNFIGDIFGGMVGVIKSAVNTLIHSINAPIKAINRLKITVPGWVPNIGGRSWAPQLATIPNFALGGTIQAQPGGSVVRVSEKGRDETIVDTASLNARYKELYNLQKSQTADTGSKIENTYNLPEGITDPHEMAREMFRLQKWG